MSPPRISTAIACLVAGWGATALAQEPTTRSVDIDSLTRAFSAQADTLPIEKLPPLENEIREWLARFQFEDESLLPPGEDPEWYYRIYRGRFLDALGWAAFRRGTVSHQSGSKLAGSVKSENAHAPRTPVSPNDR